jgi:hypothetical protein
MARLCLGLVLLLATVLGTAGCAHKKNSQVQECYPCCTPVIVEGCGCGCGAPMPVSHGGGGCGCGGY